MTKDEIADILTDIATLLELKGENPFKSRAYVNAARSLKASTEPLDHFLPPIQQPASRASATKFTTKSSSCSKPAGWPTTRI